MRPDTHDDYAAMMTAQGGSSSESQHGDSTTHLPPPAAMFAIPTHATTHASVALAEPTEDAYNESQTVLQGRPMPSTAIKDDSLSTESSRFGMERLKATLDSQLANSGPLPPLATSIEALQRNSRPTGPLWRSARSILGTESAAKTDSVNAYAVSPARVVISSPTTPASTSPRGQMPPPKYRRRKQNTADGDTSQAAAEADNSRTSPSSEQGGRFPRWRGWLEKRAMERHYEQADVAAANLAATADKEADIRRKKSWGAAVDDEDAVSESEGTLQDVPPRLDAPLHLHSFGSRFIPHLPSLPLCSVSLELPPANIWSTARLLRRQVPEESKRRILLIGTADGLYAVEVRKDRRGEEANGGDSFSRRARADPRTPQTGRGGWNGNIRTCQIWTGLGIYQMSALSTQTADVPDVRSSMYSFASRPAPPLENGILLALCSTKMESSKHHHSPPFVSGQSLHSDALAAVATTSSLSIPGHRDAVHASLSTAYIGDGGGGGQGKMAPPSGTGELRMWSIEAIRRIVAHVFDSVDHQPLDMLQMSRSNKRGTAKTSNFAARIRKAWANLGESSSERKVNRVSALYTHESALAMRYTHSAEGAPLPVASMPSLIHARSHSEELLSKSARFPQRQDSSTAASTPTGEEPKSLDATHLECLRLAHAWVPISLPGSYPYPSGGAAESVHSLYSEDGMEGMSSRGSNAHGHNHPPSVLATPSSGKGISFYALIEAGPEVNGSGTWYLALAQAKSILLYESVRPISRGDARSWAFVKEFYTPIAPKGMTFCFSQTPDPDELSRASMSSAATSASVKRQLAKHRSVKSSSYSSVFRSHPSLNLFVSMGKKAVLIRCSDANVKEVEWLSPGGRGASETDMLASPSSETGHGSASKSSLGHGHSRRVSELPDGSSAAKEHWVGLQRVAAQVIIRCKPGAQDESSGGQAGGPGISSLDEDDADDEDWDSDDGAVQGEHGVTLRDAPGQGGVSSLLRRRRSVVPAYTIFAGMAVLTKGCVSHILPSPLPRDVVQSRPLETLTWSATPTGVTASARVVGLERDLSSGPVPVNSLGRGRNRSSVSGAGSVDDGLASNGGHGDVMSGKSNSVILHVIIAVLACLPSRIEMKRVRVRLPVRMPFYFRRDSELELEPVPLPVGATGAPSTHAAVYGTDDDAAATERGGAVELHQELEYLCGILQPVQFDQACMKPWEAAGDGGAWTFDWRGADDFRLFYTGVQV